MPVTDAGILATVWLSAIFSVFVFFAICHKTISSPTRVRWVCLTLATFTAIVSCTNVVRTTWDGVIAVPTYKVSYFTCAVISADIFVAILLDLRRKLITDEQYKTFLFWITIALMVSYNTLTAAYRLFFNPDYYPPGVDMEKRLLSSRLYYVSTCFQFMAFISAYVHVFGPLVFNPKWGKINNEIFALSIWYLMVVIVLVVLWVSLFIIWLTIDFGNTNRKDALDCLLRIFWIATWTFPPPKSALHFIAHSSIFPHPTTADELIVATIPSENSHAVRPEGGINLSTYRIAQPKPAHTEPARLKVEIDQSSLIPFIQKDNASIV
ncbi:hypothetical protein BC938DRAFT_473080 [Jimgerdemannia flammicorona]|uniref:Uncharacterized protein n=1 Tax=Jimgerdemannia flammicorona TaxID=994334 RepID=A0A433Q4U9_9FUNG|nr:hypothetical protein BC938DRAFT_473080 [Jimgerdemannia flammicorona]